MLATSADFTRHIGMREPSRREKEGSLVINKPEIKMKGTLSASSRVSTFTLGSGIP